MVRAFVVLMVVGCGHGDKCERVHDKVGAFVAQHSKDAPKSRDEELAACRADLLAHPEHERMLDCLLAIDGDTTSDKLLTCANTDKPSR